MGYGDHHLWHKDEGQTWKEREREIRQEARDWLASPRAASDASDVGDGLVHLDINNDSTGIVTACGKRGSYITRNKNKVTCPKCKDKIA